MVWTGTTIQKHNGSLHGAKAAHAARIANAVLKSSGNDGTALAVAAKWAKQHKRASGGPAPKVPTYQTTGGSGVNAAGYVPVSQGGTYNLDLNTGAMSPGSLPSVRALAERGLPISGMAAPAVAAPPPVDPLANQLAPVDPGTRPLDASFFSNVGGSNARGGRLASGGASPAMPWFGKKQALAEDHVPTGLIQGPTGGRQDAVHMNLPQHSHVIPADVVGGWGQGNNDAGAIALHTALNTGPYGTALPKVPSHPRFSAPHAPRLARGGSADGKRTAVSHGEVIVYPPGVQHIGGGDYDKGHDWLDRLILHSRKQIIAKMRNLPGPVKE